MRLVAQSCPTLCDPMDCSRQATLSMGILKTRILEWAARPSPRDIPDPGIEPGSPNIIYVSVCIHIYIYMYICICTHTHIHIHIHTGITVFSSKHSIASLPALAMKSHSARRMLPRSHLCNWRRVKMQGQETVEAATAYNSQR